MSDLSCLPPRSDPRWDMVAAGHISQPWANLAMKIMMARIEQEVVRDKTDANVRRCGDRIFEFFRKNEQAAVQDLRAIFR